MRPVFSSSTARRATQSKHFRDLPDLLSPRDLVVMERHACLHRHGSWASVNGPEDTGKGFSFASRGGVSGNPRRHAAILILARRSRLIRAIAAGASGPSRRPHWLVRARNPIASPAELLAVSGRSTLPYIVRAFGRCGSRTLPDGVCTSNGSVAADGRIALHAELFARLRERGIEWTSVTLWLCGHFWPIRARTPLHRMRGVGQKIAETVSAIQACKARWSCRSRHTATRALRSQHGRDRLRSGEADRHFHSPAVRVPGAQWPDHELSPATRRRCSC